VARFARRTRYLRQHPRLILSVLLGILAYPTFPLSDVQIERHQLRRIGLAYGVLAFFFNVAVLALTINIIAGLL
jgi:uncharacterized membrane protein